MSMDAWLRPSNPCMGVVDVKCYDYRIFIFFASHHFLDCPLGSISSSLVPSNVIVQTSTLYRQAVSFFCCIEVEGLNTVPSFYLVLVEGLNTVPSFYLVWVEGLNTVPSFYLVWVKGLNTVPSFCLVWWVFPYYFIDT